MVYSEPDPVKKLQLRLRGAQERLADATRKRANNPTDNDLRIEFGEAQRAVREAEEALKKAGVVV